jgi:hypothetical protein
MSSLKITEPVEASMSRRILMTGTMLAGALAVMPHAHAVEKQQTQIQAGITSPERYHDGDRLAVAGNLVTADGHAIANGKIHYNVCKGNRGGPACGLLEGDLLTGPDGSFGFSGYPSGSGGTVFVKINYVPAADDPYLPSEVPYPPTSMIYWRLKIEGFDASERHIGKGGKVQLSGRFLSDKGTPVDGVPIILYRSYNGSDWTSVREGTTLNTGAFSLTGTASRSSFWKVGFGYLGPVGAGYDPESTPVVTAVVKGTPAPKPHAKAKTKLTFNAGPEPVRFGRKLTLKGRLTIKRNGRWAPLSHSKVGVYFRPKGSRTWRLINWITISSKNATYTKQLKANLDGTWQVRYLGNAVSSATTSPTDYVNVR